MEQQPLSAALCPEESPKLLLQFDGANDSDVERPGKVEVVTGNEPEEVEKD